jgi:hypothetical protein
MPRHGHQARIEFTSTAEYIITRAPQGCVSVSSSVSTSEIYIFTSFHQKMGNKSEENARHGMPTCLLQICPFSLVGLTAERGVGLGTW